jgi:RNA polymerase sigma-B factor
VTGAPLTDVAGTTTARPPAGDRVLDDAALFERFRRERRPADRDALVTRFSPLARHLVGRYRNGDDYEDVMQVAFIGLLKAIDRYQPDRGIAFSSFAVPTIAGEIKRYYRDLGWSVRVPRHLQELALRLDTVTEQLTSELGTVPTAQQLAARCDVSVEAILEARASRTAHRAISLDQPLGDDPGDDVAGLLGHEDPSFGRIDAADRFDSLLALLPKREQAILRMRFREDLKQRDIAQRLGISQMQVSRLIRQSLETLERAA